jgi:hypothetical protein
MMHCERLTIGQGITIGILFVSNAKHHGWKLTKASTTPAGRMLLDASMIVASIALHMQNCMAVRLLHGVPACDSLLNFDYCEMWIWLPPHAKTTPYTYISELDDCKQSINLRRLIQDLPGVTKDNWQDACVIQFWCVNTEDAGEIIKLYPDINLLGGNGASSLDHKRGRDDNDATGGKRGRSSVRLEGSLPRSSGAAATTAHADDAAAKSSRATATTAHAADAVAKATGPHNPKRRGRSNAQEHAPPPPPPPPPPVSRHVLLLKLYC